MKNVLLNHYLKWKFQKKTDLLCHSETFVNIIFTLYLFLTNFKFKKKNETNGNLHIELQKCTHSSFIWGNFRENDGLQQFLPILQVPSSALDMTGKKRWPCQGLQIGIPTSRGRQNFVREIKIH